MKLRLESFHVNAIRLGLRTAFSRGTLTIDAEELCRIARYDGSVAGVKVELVSPGEETRIIHVLDDVIFITLSMLPPTAFTTARMLAMTCRV